MEAVPPRVVQSGQFPRQLFSRKLIPVVVFRELGGALAIRTRSRKDAVVGAQARISFAGPFEAGPDDAFVIQYQFERRETLGIEGGIGAQLPIRLGKNVQVGFLPVRAIPRDTPPASRERTGPV
jgi:hypothetical protein